MTLISAQGRGEIENISPYDYRPITLKGAIQQALQKNHNQELRTYNREILDLQWKDSWATFWLPNINLTLNVDTHRIMRLRNATGLAGHNTTTPGGNFSLNFGQYTVFNWGKDYLTFLNTKQRYRRNVQVLTEDERELKHTVVENYYNMVTERQKLEAYKTYLVHASMAYRLAKEKVAAKKVSSQEYYQTRTLYLKAQKSYHDSQRELNSFHERMAYLIDDDINVRYILSEEVKFSKIDQSMNKLVKVAMKNNPDVLSAISTKDNAERSYEVTKRDNLALPRFTIDLGAYNQGWGTGIYGQSYVGATGNRNLEIVGTLTATWTIVGQNGLLNRRRTQQSNLQLKHAKRSQHNQEDFASYNVSNYYNRIKNYEKTFELAKEKAITAEKTYNIVLNNYTLRRTSFLNFLHALEDLTDAKIDHLSTLNSHAIEKVNLARICGVEDFPGDLFENSISKKILREENQIEVEEIKNTNKRN